MELDFSSLSNSHEQVYSTSELQSRNVNELTIESMTTSSEEVFDQHAIRNENGNSTVILQIEDIFSSIADAILKEESHLVINLKTRYKPKSRIHDKKSGVIRSLPDEETKAIKFPSRKPHEAWKFAAVLRILELCHEALITGVIATKRDIFYHDPELFIKQAVVDRYIDDIAYTLGVTRDALNVVAAAKGLVAGSFTMTRTNSTLVDYAAEHGGTLIPDVKDIRFLHMKNVHWILLIEKEATFRTLSTGKYWDKSVHGKGIILTAKGYPDIQTRHLLFYLCSKFPQVPIYGLVDFDPDGLGILSTYKYGSVALAHCNEGLAVPKIIWLGVKSCEIFGYGVNSTYEEDCRHGERNAGSDKVGLLRLTPRDRRIAKSMLSREILWEEGREAAWRRELQVMLILNIKAEIQILSQSRGGLEGWLDGQLGEIV